MPRMQADTNLFYHRSTYQKGEEFEVLDTDVKALEDQGHAHVVKNQTTKAQDLEPKQGDSTTTQKPVSKMNRTELEAYAESIGIAGPFEQYSTKADLLKVVEAHQ